MNSPAVFGALLGIPFSLSLRGCHDVREAQNNEGQRPEQEEISAELKHAHA